MKRKLKINVLAGIFDIINAFMIMISWGVVLFAAVGEAAANGSGHVTGGVAAVFYVIAIIGLILHIVGLVQSKKARISIVGHILGIIGCGCFVITMALAFPAFVLVVLAAIFTLRQKNLQNA
ncbi:transporter [Bacillus sp. FJAT-49736]|uniref:transporter n=1 Tax=Bacillus sp. FJAT-49736 TaxID=2833582 RepID=UPI001BC9FA7B|nr:transporter [Bacillus sp. FJAT-49736]MBS4174209.1 transporter [Bacillus sp. FJAT-49736]